MSRLGRFDLSGCRQALGRLVEKLNGTGDGLDRQAQALFLYDVLGQMHRFLFRGTDPADGDTERRAGMLEALVDARDSTALRLAFLDQIDGLLRPFEQGALALNPVVERARRFIEENSSGKLSLRKIAEHVNVSRNYLSTLFKKQCGTTITDYIHQVRMQRAELLLLAGGRTISEVAYMVGYQNYRDFYRNFVKFTNSSPTRFRQSLGTRSGNGESAPVPPPRGGPERVLRRS
jgi:AraC-like DNA-binding protein